MKGAAELEQQVNLSADTSLLLLMVELHGCEIKKDCRRALVSG